jgi:hypothetical protein
MRSPASGRSPRLISWSRPHSFCIHLPKLYTALTQSHLPAAAASDRCKQRGSAQDHGLWVIKYWIIPAHTRGNWLLRWLLMTPKLLIILNIVGFIDKVFLLAVREIESWMPQRNEGNCRRRGQALRSSLLFREEIAPARRGDKKINFAINIDAVQLDLHNWASNRAWLP